jgi:IQ and AAA domain-containing protein
MPRSDFVNLDEIIMDLKLTPDCIDLPIPRYFREEEKRRLDERNFLIDELLLEYHDTKEPEVEQWEDRPLINEIDED